MQHTEQIVSFLAYQASLESLNHITTQLIYIEYAYIVQNAFSRHLPIKPASPPVIASHKNTFEYRTYHTEHILSSLIYHLL